MANIKISELNEITKSQTAYNDYLPIVDTSANETKKISVENLTANNVYLLAVVKPNGQVPVPETGAKYYNESTNKIYYAPDDEHWNEYGTPVEGIFYVVLGEKGNYIYDAENETLVSVGGGSGSEIIIGDEEPTEDTKMIIDTDAFDPQYSDITDEYSEASDKAYSCNYVNKKVEWQTLGENLSGSIFYQLPSVFNELLVLVNIGGSNVISSIIIPNKMINSTTKYVRQGYYFNSSNSRTCGVEININDGIKLREAFNNGSDVLSSSTCDIYYR